MKKIFLMLACASTMAASAQVALVSEAQKLIGGGDIAAKVAALEKIQPALTNPETADQANTWYVAGKLAFSIVDKCDEARIMNQPFDVDIMGDALFKGYEYLQYALPLDSIGTLEVDKKTGEPKLDKAGNKKYKDVLKYNKDINTLLVSHADDANVVGDAFLNAANYGKAADAYDYFLHVIQSPMAAANKIPVPHDSILGNVNFLVGYCTYFADGDKDYRKAFDRFNTALSLGYTGNQCEDFRNAAFLAEVQNLMANEATMSQVMPFIDSAIAADPSAANFYDIKGQVLMGEEKLAEAEELFNKAMELDPTYGDSYLNMGRAIYAEADKYIADNQQMTDKQLAPALIPLYEKALPFLNKAIELDKSENKTLEKQAKGIIDDIDYKFELLGHKK